MLDVPNSASIHCIVTAVLLAVATPAQADVWYVQSGAVGGDGSCWAQALGDMQDALGAAGGGDEIWVAAGTYKPTAGAGRNKTFTLTSDVAWYGGFAGDESSRHERDPKRNETILSGDIGIIGDTSDNVFHVVSKHDLLFNGEPRMDGFTITQGNADGFPGNGHAAGGGLLITGGNASYAIVRCRFVDNLAKFGGGAHVVNLDDGSLRFVNCEFINNRALPKSSGVGGAFWIIDSSNVELINCVIRGNKASRGGGGAIQTNLNGTVDVRMKHCTFYDNRKFPAFPGRGGALWVDLFGIYEPQVVKATNSILWGNSAPQIFESFLNSVEVHYTDIQNGWSGRGSNHIDSDPGFCDAAAGDLRLADGSPCIDAANNEIIPADSADLNDNGNRTEELPWDASRASRRVDSATGNAEAGTGDMGAFENPHHLGCPQDLNGDHQIDLADLAIILSDFGTHDCLGSTCKSDFDCNRDVDLTDLTVLLSLLGQTC